MTDYVMSYRSNRNEVERKCTIHQLKVYNIYGNIIVQEYYKYIMALDPEAAGNLG